MSMGFWIVLALGAGGVATGTDASIATDEQKADDPRLLNGGAERTNLLKRLPSKDRTCVRLAVSWLLAHQEENGSWDADEFMKHDPDEDRCDGGGLTEVDIGVTALASMALMGGAELTTDQAARTAVEKAVGWLVAQQDGESGLIGEKIGLAYLYDHALATIAVCEAIAVLDEEGLAGPARKAVACIEKARNPNAVWRYELPPVGDNDTSVTSLMITALATARDVGLKVDPEAFEDALSWVDSVTDATTGRVGYDSTGSTSSRMPGINDEYPVTETEVMTAAGLSVRFFCGEESKKARMIPRHAELIQKALPVWHEKGLTCDFYYWYHGSVAMHQVDSKSWKAWKKSLVKALGEGQIRRGSAKGSWDPIGPWGFYGGRVYSTALGALSLTEPVRHRRLSGK